MVICLEQGADLHMSQLMPLPLTVSCFSKIQIGFTFLVPADLGSPGQRAVKRVCVCVCVTRRSRIMPNSHRSSNTTKRSCPCRVRCAGCCELNDCCGGVQTSNFSVGDSLELSGIQFTPSKRTRHRQDSFVVSRGRCELGKDY